MLREAGLMEDACSRMRTNKKRPVWSERALRRRFRMPALHAQGGKAYRRLYRHFIDPLPCSDNCLETDS